MDKTRYIYLVHEDDPRIPAESGWGIAVWSNGRSRACWPGLYPLEGVGYGISLSTFEAALEHLLEVYADNQES
jgi:hypothetical protein